MNRRALVEIINLAVIVLVTTLASLKLMLLPVEQLPWAALLVVVGSLANAVYIRRNGSIDVAARILIALLLFGLVYAGSRTGAFSGPVVLLSPLIPLFSVLLLSVRSGWITLGLVSVILGGLLFFQVNGTIAENKNPHELILLARLITVLGVCLASTWIVGRFARMSRSLVARVEQQSHIDFLTGILNRRGVETILERELGRARRTNGWLSLILADVDRFKLYNDTNGHQAGDDCLARVAQVICSCGRRAGDTSGRFGGEEFVVILPEASSRGAYDLAERMRREMLNQKIPYGTPDSDCVSLTIGVVSARGQEIESIEQLIRLADDALYQGKRQGRNCVVKATLGDIGAHGDTPGPATAPEPPVS